MHGDPTTQMGYGSRNRDNWQLSPLNIFLSLALSAHILVEWWFSKRGLDVVQGQKYGTLLFGHPPSGLFCFPFSQHTFIPTLSPIFCSENSNFELIFSLTLLFQTIYVYYLNVCSQQELSHLNSSLTVLGITTFWVTFYFVESQNFSVLLEPFKNRIIV